MAARFSSQRGAELAAGKGFLFADRGDAAIRRYEDPVRLYELRWTEDSARAAAAHEVARRIITGIMGWA